jgi:hypothetical protein
MTKDETTDEQPKRRARRACHHAICQEIDALVRRGAAHGVRLWWLSLRPLDEPEDSRVIGTVSLHADPRPRLCQLAAVVDADSTGPRCGISLVPVGLDACAPADCAILTTLRRDCPLLWRDDVRNLPRHVHVLSAAERAVVERVALADEQRPRPWAS